MNIRRDMIKTKIRRKLIMILSMLIILLSLVLISNYSFSMINRELIYGLLIIAAVLALIFMVSDYEDFSIREGYYKKLFNLLDYFNTFIFALLTLQVIYSFVIFPSVHMSSMVPTLNEGDRIVVVMDTNLKRFDIVVFEVDSDKLENIPLSENGSLWVKRVIGLPGEKVEYLDGVLYINNVKVIEPFLLDEFGKPYLGQYETVLPSDMNGKIIPEGYYLFMGDNRSHSTDSREIGYIPKSLVVGKGKFIINSIFDWEKIGE